MKRYDEVGMGRWKVRIADLDEQCLRLGRVGDVVVLHGFGMMVRKSVTGMRGQGSDSERYWFCVYLVRACALSLQK
jgi:hypothetical protein